MIFKLRRKEQENHWWGGRSEFMDHRQMGVCGNQKSWKEKKRQDTGYQMTGLPPAGGNLSDKPLIFVQAWSLCSAVIRGFFCQ